MPTDFVPTAAARKMNLRWYQYSLRSLMIVVTLACIAMGWVATKMKQARQQKAAVDAILKVAGGITYDYQKDAFDTTSKPPGPAWLRKVLGDNLLVNVTRVDLHQSGASDALLEHLKRLTQLQELRLIETRVNDAGVKELQKALPKCRIEGNRWIE